MTLRTVTSIGESRFRDVQITITCTETRAVPELSIEHRSSASGDVQRYFVQCSFRFVMLRGRNRILARRRLSADGRHSVLIGGSRSRYVRSHCCSPNDCCGRKLSGVASWPNLRQADKFLRFTRVLFLRHPELPGRQKNRIQGFQSVGTCVN